MKILTRNSPFFITEILRSDPAAQFQRLYEFLRHLRNVRKNLSFSEQNYSNEYRNINIFAHTITIYCKKTFKKHIFQKISEIWPFIHIDIVILLFGESDVSGNPQNRLSSGYFDPGFTRVYSETSDMKSSKSINKFSKTDVFLNEKIFSKTDVNLNKHIFSKTDIPRTNSYFLKQMFPEQTHIF